MFKISKYLAMICCSVSAFGTTIYDYENDYAMFNPVYRSICGDYENNCLKYYPNVLYTNEENIYKEIYKIFYTPDLNNIFF